MLHLVLHVYIVFMCYKSDFICKVSALFCKVNLSMCVSGNKVFMPITLKLQHFIGQFCYVKKYYENLFTTNTNLHFTLIRLLRWWYHEYIFTLSSFLTHIHKHFYRIRYSLLLMVLVFLHCFVKIDNSSPTKILLIMFYVQQPGVKMFKKSKHLLLKR